MFLGRRGLFGDCTDSFSLIRDGNVSRLRNGLKCGESVLINSELLLGFVRRPARHFKTLSALRKLMFCAQALLLDTPLNEEQKRFAQTVKQVNLIFQNFLDTERNDFQTELARLYLREIQDVVDDI